MIDPIDPVVHTLVAALVVAHGRKPATLDKAHERIARLVYLCDWKASIEHGRTITGLDWSFEKSGPRLEDAVEAVAATIGALPPFRPQADKRLIREAEGLSDEDRSVVDHVVAATHGLDPFRLVLLVASTWPSMTRAGHGGPADLPACALAYAETTKRQVA